MENLIVSVQSSLLFQCVQISDADALRKMLKLGASPNVYDGEGNPLIFMPIVNGDPEMLDIILCDERCDTNIKSLDSRTPLLIAVEMDDLKIVKRLVKAGAYVDSVDETGKTPLLLALEEGKFDIAEYLINHGSNVNIVDGFGRNALCLVANGSKNDYLRIVEKILKSGFLFDDNIDRFSPDSRMEKNAISKIIKKVKNTLKVITGSRSSTIVRTT